MWWSCRVTFSIFFFVGGRQATGPWGDGSLDDADPTRHCETRLALSPSQRHPPHPMMKVLSRGSALRGWRQRQAKPEATASAGGAGRGGKARRPARVSKGQGLGYHAVKQTILLLHLRIDDDGDLRANARKVGSKSWETKNRHRKKPRMKTKSEGNIKKTVNESAET